MSHYIHIGIVLGALFFVRPAVLTFTQEAVSEEGAGEPAGPLETINGGNVIPDQARRPSGREDPRYPRDAVIGELGQGQASGGAYSFGRELLSALLGGNGDSAALSGVSAGQKAEIAGILKAIDAEKYRMGGGREEDDGSTSFLFRFIGRKQGATGELYLRREGETWRIDDIIIEKPRDSLDRVEPYPYDFTPYERFF